MLPCGSHPRIIMNSGEEKHFFKFQVVNYKLYLFYIPADVFPKHATIFFIDFLPPSQPLASVNVSMLCKLNLWRLYIILRNEACRPYFCKLLFFKVLGFCKLIFLWETEINWNQSPPWKVGIQFKNLNTEK